MTNHELPKLIFVGGAPRSGTTLLQNMLDSHPDITGGPEFLHLPDIIQLRKSMQHSLNKGWLEEYCTAEQADHHLKRLINDFLQPVAKNNHTVYVSEKTPANIIVFSDLAELYPNARFIEIVRDPRAVVASMLKVGRRGQRMGMQTQSFTRNILDAVSYLRTCYAKGTDFQTRNPDQLMTVRYEVLVTRPEAVTRKICDFLELPWDERMLRPDKQKHLGEKAITNEVWYNQQEYHRRPTDAEIEKWRNQLNAAQKALLFHCFRRNPSMLRNGYRLDDEFASQLCRQSVSLCGKMVYLALDVRRKLNRHFFRPFIARLGRD